MRIPVIIFILLLSRASIAQTYRPDLQDKKQTSLTKRSVSNIDENGKKGIRIEAGEGGNLLVLNNIVFSNGTIELDLRGRDKMGQSFVGFAFHIQNDSTYDAIYFRPFNFSNPDTLRRWRAVQYISNPEYDWSKLREQFPGKYENKVNPVPDGNDWFHCKIVVKNKQVTVFVNNSTTPSLAVIQLSNWKEGKLGLWVENGSDGSYANLVIMKE
ncbi:family 16 glycoside hydrolase [Pollutibacter soli]|uniref:family 16 glycoside hydrolase n=1 Tax=Pollutibacter soli TaxID=3034157 RepID=UPI0030134FD6